MRIILLAPLACLLVGCTTARQAMGAYAAAAEKGIEISVGDTAEAPAPRGPDGRPLPGGLIGDTANRAYAPVPPN